MADGKRTRRDYKTGGMRERAPNSWELKVHTFDQKAGRRVAKFYTFKGSKTAAKQKLRDLMILADDGALPDEQRLLGTLLDAWDAGLDVSPKTAERYRELVSLYIRPHLGALKVRTITASRIEQFYGDLRSGVGPAGGTGASLAPRTISHIHRLVVQVLALAERDKLIQSNPARHAKRPKIKTEEIEILEQSQVREVLEKLHGNPMQLIAAVGLFTGMRRGEILALRWKDVDFSAGEINVRQSLEETKAGVRLKGPKTKYGTRKITVGVSLVTQLRAHWKSQTEARLAAGLGKDPEDGLVFRHADGSPLLPNSVSASWRKLVRALGSPKVTMHAWRHTHASQLIAEGLDVLTISRRLGHGSPSITLDVYSHLFKPTDKAASAVFEAAYADCFKD